MKNYIFGRYPALNAIEKNDSVENIYLLNNFSDSKIMKLIKEKRIPYEFVSNKELNKLVGEVNHQGIVLQVKEYEYLSLEEMISKNEDNPLSLLVMLDEIQDPHNFGAILRSVDAFNAQGVIISSNRQVGITPTVVKVSTGAIEYVDVCKVTNLNQAIQKLKDNGYWIVSSSLEASVDYRKVDYNSKIVLVIGNEGFGVSKLIQKNSDFRIKIPMTGNVNSLNASVATGIMLAEIYNKRNPL